MGKVLGRRWLDFEFVEFGDKVIYDDDKEYEFDVVSKERCYWFLIIEIIMMKVMLV